VTVSNRVDVMHGVNFDVLQRRDASQYGGLSLAQLEAAIAGYADDFGLQASFFQTNSEREFVEHLHDLDADALVVNPGAWTHYAWAIHDALSVVGVPAVEVHLSDIHAREPWRRVSVVSDLCVATFAGHGVEGYRLALESISRALGSAETTA
jgi:3-dehydroquinate dehydratase-2